MIEILSLLRAEQGKIVNVFIIKHGNLLVLPYTWNLTLFKLFKQNFQENQKKTKFQYLATDEGYETIV